MKNVRVQTTLDPIDFHCIDKTKTFFKIYSFLFLSHTVAQVWNDESKTK